MKNMESSTIDDTILSENLIVSYGQLMSRTFHEKNDDIEHDQYCVKNVVKFLKLVSMILML